VLFLTERASFRLTAQGVELFEIAPGIDLQHDVLDQMDFVPRLSPTLAVMPADLFNASTTSS
jgi:acyl CoA:acetate/3-ketoacid CoA transferase